jgi:ferredoxin
MHLATAHKRTKQAASNNWSKKGECRVKHTIYCFSGTGNSLYAAKQLALALAGAELVSIATCNPIDEDTGGDNQRIGFVFPSYYGDLPRLVRSFIEKLPVPPGTDVFCVVTMGAFGRGSVKALRDLLEEKGLKLRFGVGMRMPPNYILSYDPALFGARSHKRIEKRLSKVSRRIERIAEDIMSNTSKVEASKLSSKTLYTNVELLDADFAATEKCVACGLCERLCPVGNIKLINSKPEWQHFCERCVACISWCPVSAIEYGKVTQRRTRYHNPHMTAAELAATGEPLPVARVSRGRIT